MSAGCQSRIRWRALADAGHDERLLHDLRFLWADPFGEGLLVVDCHVADLEYLVAVTGTSEDQPDELHQDVGHQG